MEDPVLGGTLAAISLLFGPLIPKMSATLFKKAISQFFSEGMALLCPLHISQSDAPVLSAQPM